MVPDISGLRMVAMQGKALFATPIAYLAGIIPFITMGSIVCVPNWWSKLVDQPTNTMKVTTTFYHGQDQAATPK